MTDGKDRLEKVESLIPGNAFHGQALKADRSGLTGSVCHIQFTADQIPAPGPQPHAEGFLVQGIGIFRTRNMKNCCFIYHKAVTYPFTPPAVRPETMYFCILKNTARMGNDTRTAAAEKRGQLRL